MEESGESRTTTITNTEPGIYRVNVSAFGKTISGREFRLVVPEFSFNVEENNYLLNTAGDVNADGTVTINETADELRVKAEQEREEAMLLQQQAQDAEDKETIIIIAAGNSVIILIAVVLFFTLRRKKTKSK